LAADAFPPNGTDAIRLILADVDGVLSDGSIIYDSRGNELKSFHVRDGLGIKLWQMAGGKFGLLTARQSPIVMQRAAELGIDLVSQGREGKLVAGRAMWQALGLEPSQVCYIGDDLTDLPVLQAVGFSATVADAVAEVRAVVDFETTQPGGRGAVRELIEVLLRGQKRWEATLAGYLQSLGGP